MKLDLQFEGSRFTLDFEDPYCERFSDGSFTCSIYAEIVFFYKKSRK